MSKSCYFDYKTNLAKNFLSCSSEFYYIRTMKKLVFLVFCLAFLAFISCKDGKRYHDETDTISSAMPGNALENILEFQKELNIQFKDPEQSPLPDRYRKDFEGLDFFKPDTIFTVRAYLERTPEALPFLMPTTTERKSTERVYGIAHFEMEQKEFELEIYQNLEHLKDKELKTYLFLPFTDGTNGNETYTGGRYIDLEIPRGDSLLIDFNKAYNPYCVYNKKYSCPLVPEVNHLDIEIRAGVKMFKTKEP